MNNDKAESTGVNSLNTIDTESTRAHALELLRELVAIPTWEGNTEREALIFLKEWLKRFGVYSELREEGGQVLSLVSRLGGRNDPLIFNSHVDTVPPSGREHWQSDPFNLTVEGTLARGLGAVDAKGCVAAMVTAFVALHNAWEGEEALQLMIVGGEERGGLGTLMEARGGLAGAAIVGEPTSLIPCGACKGVLRLEVETTGKAAHSSSPESGVNAIYPMGALLLELEQLAKHVSENSEQWTGNASLAVTLIEGGTAQNVIPSRCSVHVDRRLVPGERAEDAHAEIEDIIDDVRKRYPSVSFSLTQLRMLDPVCIDAGERVVQACQNAARRFGRTDVMNLQGFTACCDLCHIVHEGKIPGVIWGPGPLNQAHQVNEALPLNEFELALQGYYNAGIEWAKGPARFGGTG